MKRILIISTFIAIMMLMMASIWNAPLVKSKGYIKGSVADITSRKGLDCSSIAFTSKDNPGISYGTLSDSKGNFYVRSIPFGKYYLSTYLIGYKKKIVKEVEVSKSNKHINIGMILMQKDLDKNFNFEISASRLIKGSPYLKNKDNKTVLSDIKLLNNNYYL